jgi:hypothetical protein
MSKFGIARRSGTRLLAGVAASLLLLAAGGLSSAQAATASPFGAHKADQYCTATSTRPDPAKPDAVISHEVCSADPNDPAIATPAGQTVLVIVYQDNGWNNRFQSLTGSAGPCDATGYQFNNLTAINSAVGGISSYSVENNCDHTSIYNQVQLQNHCADLLHAVYYVGDACNEGL